jgi:flagellar biosynthesis protein FlhG
MLDFRGDQAAGLRRLFGGRRQRVVTFTAAGDGVGKTQLVANLAAAIAAQGRSVLVVDENAGHDDVVGAFGARATLDLLDAIQGRRLLDEVLLGVDPGVRVLPAARAVNALGQLTAVQQESLLHAVATLGAPPDVILVDAAHDHPLGFSPFGLVTPETVLVLSASGASITATYALIKQVSQRYGRRQFRVLINKAKTVEEAEQVYANLAHVAAQRAVASISLAGTVPADDNIRAAARLLRPVVAAFPDSPGAAAIRGLAADLQAWPQDDEPEGLEQFMRQLLHLSSKITPRAAKAR